MAHFWRNAQNPSARHEVLQQIEQLLDVRVEVFRARNGAPAFRLQFRPFEFDVQRVHETVHQPAKCGDGCQLDDLGIVEVPGEFRKRVIVITRLVPVHQFGPADDRLLALIEKRAIGIVVSAQGIELLLGPTCRSPNQAIVLDSIFALVQCRDFVHRQRPDAGIELATQTVFLQNSL